MENTPNTQFEKVYKPYSTEISDLQESFHDALLIVSTPHTARGKATFRLPALAALLLPLLLLQQHDGGPGMPSSAVSSAPIAMHAAAPVSAASSSLLPTEREVVLRLGIPRLAHASSMSAASPVSFSASFSSSSSVASDQPDNHIGVYLTAGSARDASFLTQTMKDAGAAHANAIVVDAKTNYVFFNTTAPMARKLGLVSEQYNLQDLVKEAHERGMYLIMRYVAISDSGLASALPETQLKDPKTGNVITPGYIDPANPEALAYNSEIICDLAKNGVDEINLDYIRFATSNVYATAAYSTAEKSARVNAFVQMARDTIDRCGPRTKLGLSVFAILGWNYKANVATLGQDIPELAKIADVISPMAYPAMFRQDAYYDPSVDRGSRMYYLVLRTMQGFQKLMGDNAWKLRPWLQGYGVTTKNVADQIQAAMDSNLCGFQFWNADNVYSGAVYRGMKNWVLPDRCK